MEKKKYMGTAALSYIIQKIHILWKTLSKVATSGDYNDLVNAPEIPDLSSVAVFDESGEAVTVPNLVDADMLGGFPANFYQKTILTDSPLSQKIEIVIENGNLFMKRIE